MANSRDYDKALFRLLDIVGRLKDGERYTLKELAREYNVSERTIRRDIDDRLSYYPIVQDTQKRYYIENPEEVDRRSLFTDEEIISLYLGLNSISKSAELFSKSAKSLLYKTFLKEIHTPYFIKNRPYEYIDTDSKLLDTIEEAIQKRLISDIEVNKRAHSIEPLKIINIDGYWHLFAKMVDSSKHRVFFIKDISSFSPTKRAFRASDDLVVLLDRVYSHYFDDEKSFEVVVKIKSKIAKYFTYKNHLPSQKLKKEYDNGDIAVSFIVTHIEDVDNLIKSWLPDIEVISPKEYKGVLQKELEEYISALKRGVDVDMN